MSHLYDVIVVGSGPAGGVTAYELVRHSLEVLILEQERLPRYKPCAGGLPIKTAYLLDLDPRPTFEAEIRRGLVTYRLGEPVFLDFGRVVGWTVMRSRFDHFIVQQAVAAGARLLEGVAVKGVEMLSDRVVAQTGGETFSARVLVGADGAKSVVARSVGMLTDRETGTALESEIRVSQAVLEERRDRIHLDFGSVPRGYAWVFPKRDHLSVGVGVFRGKAANLKARLSRFIEGQEGLRDGETMKTRGHLMSLGGIERPLHRGRVLLVGDAAALTDPLLGEGIYYAMKSGQLAATVIRRALARGDPDLSPYTRQVNAQITRDFRYARRIAALLYAFPWLGYHLFRKNASLRQGIAGVIEGNLSYEALYNWLKTRFLSLLLDALRGRG